MQLETTSAAPNDWDDYVRKQSDGSVYHHSAALQVGTVAFGLRTRFLTARDAGRRVIGVLPLVEQSSLLFGRFLVSLPFFNYGGILADGPEVVAALAAAAAELARERGASHVELRQTRALNPLGLPARTDKACMLLKLPDSEAALNRQLGSKLRSQIRRADRERPEVIWGGAELIPDFYSVFATTMHRLGTPVYSRRFFEVACQALQAWCRVLVLRVAGMTAAAAIIVRHGSRIEVPWAAATPEAKHGALNMRLYWEMLAYSVRCGAREFDFGRSTRDSGTYRFKAQWGAQPLQLHWYYWLARGKDIPQLNPSNPKYALAAALWRRMPLFCANLLGPHIVKNLP